MRNYWLPGLAGLLLAPAVQAQQPSIQQAGAAAQANLNALVSGAPAVVPRGSSEATVGSPYLDKRWLPARITMSNKVPLAPVPLKFDVLNQRLLMRPLDRPTDSLLLNEQLVAGFELEEPATPLTPARPRRFRRFTEAPDLRQRTEFVEVVHEGRYTLLRRYTKQLRKADYQQAYSSGRGYDEIEDQAQYFLRRPDQTLVPLKLTLKTLLAAAPELAPALKANPAAGKAKTDAEWAAVLAAAEAR